jgi:hypothetical protein
VGLRSHGSRPLPPDRMMAAIEAQQTQIDAMRV